MRLEPLDQVDLKETKALQDFLDWLDLPGNKDQWGSPVYKVPRVILAHQDLSEELVLQDRKVLKDKLD